jgi:hypothetical protein
LYRPSGLLSSRSIRRPFRSGRSTSKWGGFAESAVVLFFVIVEIYRVELTGHVAELSVGFLSRIGPRQWNVVFERCMPFCGAKSEIPFWPQKVEIPPSSEELSLCPPGSVFIANGHLCPPS